jgi:hypothetical protein
MQRVPYQGVSRMTTSMKRKHRDRVVRRGLGMLIESDFYTTPAGREHFSNQIQSIRYCVQETVSRNVFVNLNPSLGVCAVRIPCLRLLMCVLLTVQLRRPLCGECQLIGSRLPRALLPPPCIVAHAV